MGKDRILIKLGGRKHLGEERWRGALSIFNKIYVPCFFNDRDWIIENDNIITIRQNKTFLKSKLLGLLNRTNSHKSLNWLSWLSIYFMRLLNRSWINEVRNIDSDFILCSYGDYDKSDLTCLIAKPAINKPIVRAYKETRPEYSFKEVKALHLADIIVLYDKELKIFLEKKYGKDLFKSKKVLLGYDENALPSCILTGIRYDKKYSEQDGKVHLVILTFRVDSSPNRDRDEGRYYYIDVIKALIQSGIIVHLHCAQYNDDNGINRYKELQDKNPGMFFMEPALEMKHSSTASEWIKSCEILSRYDAGLLHNIVGQSRVSAFDKINIPHRFFAYEAAHVTPIIKRGENVVLERMFAEKKCGFVYNSFEDLPKLLHTGIEYYTPSYEDYLKAIFNL